MPMRATLIRIAMRMSSAGSMRDSCLPATVLNSAYPDCPPGADAPAYLRPPSGVMLLFLWFLCLKHRDPDAQRPRRIALGVLEVVISLRIRRPLAIGNGENLVVSHSQLQRLPTPFHRVVLKL